MSDRDHFIIRLILNLAGKVGIMSQQIEELNNAVTTLESDDENLKVSVGAAVVELANLENQVKELEANQSVTPEQAKELTDRINKVAEGLTTSTESLNKAAPAQVQPPAQQPPAPTA